MTGLISDGRVYIAVPPLYRIDIGKETFWAADDEDRERILAETSRPLDSGNNAVQGVG